jgi:hypothetical protein
VSRHKICWYDSQGTRLCACAEKRLRLIFYLFVYDKIINSSDVIISQWLAPGIHWHHEIWNSEWKNKNCFFFLSLRCCWRRSRETLLACKISLVCKHLCGDGEASFSSKKWHLSYMYIHNAQFVLKITNVPLPRFPIHIAVHILSL